MSDTIREQIIQKFAIQLATLTKANGFNYDLGAGGVRNELNPDGSILRAPPYNIPIEQLPFVTFFPGMDADVSFVYQKVRQTMSIIARGYMVYGTENPSVMGEKILGDLIKGLTSSDWTSEMADEISYQGGGIEEYPTEEHPAVVSICQVGITYKTVNGDPYTQ